MEYKSIVTWWFTSRESPVWGGDLNWPSSSTDNYIARAKWTHGKEVDYAPATVDDDWSINIPTGQNYKINNTDIKDVPQSLTNKTINADNNTISNIEFDNFKSWVLDTDISSVSSNHDTLASSKSIKAYSDTKVIRETGMLVMSIASSVSWALKFDGVSSYSKTTYSALYALISAEVWTAYDVDSNNFYLPNASGRVLGIAWQGSGLTFRSIFHSVWDETHTLSINEMPSHSHNYSRFYNRTEYASNFVNTNESTWDETNQYSTRSTTSTWWNQAHNNMQPTMFAWKHLFIYY